MNWMTRWLVLAFGVWMAGAAGAADAPAVTGPGATPLLWSEAWNRMIDANVTSGDWQGHGPDIGSDEWQGTIEFRLGVPDDYVRRATELQAKYRLVPSRGPSAFACDGNPANEVTVTYFATEPATITRGYGAPEMRCKLTR